MDIFLVNSSGHFLMAITNSANTVGQPMQGVRTLFSVRSGDAGTLTILIARIASWDT